MATEIEERLGMEFYSRERDRGYRARCARCRWKTRWTLDQGERDTLAEYHASTHALTPETPSHTLSE